MRQTSIYRVKPGEILGQAILSQQGRILLNRGFVLSDSIIRRLHKFGFTMLIIDDDFSNDIIFQDIVSFERRREALMYLETFSEDLRIGRKTDLFRLNEVVNDIIDDIIYEKELLLSLLDIRSYDTQVFAHSVSVCILAVMLGKVMGLNREMLNTLAVGSILHDIGLVELPQDLLRKREPFTAQEMNCYMSHAEIGFKILQTRDDVNLVSAHMAYQHHELLDGSGYPRGLTGKKLHPLAQIVALADFYDNLVNEGPGHSRIDPNEAVEILMTKANILFPYDLIKAFIDHVAVYPNGCTVELNSGEIGVVVSQNRSFPTRPIVRIFDELQQSQLNHSNHRTYNMVEHLTLFIRKIVA